MDQPRIGQEHDRRVAYQLRRKRVISVQTPSLSTAQKQKIIDALMRVGGIRPCPRCGNPNFATAEALCARILQPSLPNMSLSGMFVPTCLIYCLRCGFISEHAIAVLGLSINDFQITPEGR